MLGAILRNRLLFPHALLLLIGLESSLPAEEHHAKLPPAAGRQVDYERDVQPIFQLHCLDCHGPDTQESHLRVDRERSLLAGGDSGEPAVIRGKSAGSLLIRAVAGLDPNLQMPPGDSLSADEIGILRAWIEQGMQGIESGDEEGNSLGTDHWSFQPVRRPEVPGLTSIDAHSPRQHRSVPSAEPPPNGLDLAELDRNSLPPPPRNEQAIDAFIAARLHEVGLDFSPPADRRTLIRRLYLDVLGLLPHPSEVDNFLQDTSPDAYEQLVERALAHPGYGERWGRHWLDVVRFAETNGFETNTPRPNAYHYRDYVIQALNQDKSYDQFVLEQLAGDSIGADAATGFLVAGPYDEVKSPDVNLTMMQRQDELADMINVSGGAFLGLTLGCARCHNHKFDPVSQRDFYALQAVFAGVRHGERPLPTEEGRRNRERATELARQLERAEQSLERFARPGWQSITEMESKNEAETNAESKSELRTDSQSESQTEPQSPSALVSKSESSLKTGTESERGSVSPSRLGDAYAQLVDDRDTEGEVPSVQWFRAPRGIGENPPGTERGFREDPGDVARLPNLSRGAYSWWQARPEETVASYRPDAEGHFAVWVSWGCGFETHAADAQFVLDRDGNPATTEDQVVLAEVDQRRFADGTEPAVQASLWSGLRFVGVHSFGPETRVLVRNGKFDAAVTSDVFAFQQVQSASKDSDRADVSHPAFPQLRAPIQPDQNDERFPAAPAKWVRFRIDESGGAEPCLDELELYVAGDDETNVALASLGSVPSSSGDYQGNPKHQLEHLVDGLYGNSHSWISNQPDRGWVQIELPREMAIGRVRWGRDRLGEFRDRVPTRYVIEVATEPGEWQVVASSRQRLPNFIGQEWPLAYRYRAETREDRKQLEQLLSRRRELQAELARLQQPGPAAYIGQLEQPAATRRLYRGDPMQPREEVLPDALSVLGTLGLSEETPEPQRRLALAQWIISEDNPLAARVIANRVWQHHFGRGLVATPSDFGGNGVEPSHPKLLDWLACELRDHGWSLKHLRRQILTSRTYRQSSTPHQAGWEADAESRLLWRFPPRRLEAEVLRDNLLAVSGVLDNGMFGRGFDAFEPNSNYVRVYIPKETMGPETWRRMVYMTKVRMEQDAVFGAFDCPDAGQSTPVRGRSTTAIQALNLFNSPFVHDLAQRLADRISQECEAARLELGPTESERSSSIAAQADEIERLFRLTLGRSPSDEERDDALRLSNEYGLQAVCRAVLNSNEFLTIP